MFAVRTFYPHTYVWQHTPDSAQSSANRALLLCSQYLSSSVAGSVRLLACLTPNFVVLFLLLIPHFCPCLTLYPVLVNSLVSIWSSLCLILACFLFARFSFLETVFPFGSQSNDYCSSYWNFPPHAANLLTVHFGINVVKSSFFLDYTHTVSVLQLGPLWTSYSSTI